MRLTRHAFLIVLQVCLVTPGFANEPLWTAEEHAAHRDVIVEATVLETSEEGEISDSETLWTAVLKIEEIRKSDERVDDLTQIVIYFVQPLERSGPGWMGQRCPTYPVVEGKARRVFYLSHAEDWDGSTAYWLDFGQDVKRVSEGGGWWPRGIRGKTPRGAR